MATAIDTVDRPLGAIRGDERFFLGAAIATTMDRAIPAWRADNNTFPSLPSKPQRTVGWVTSL